MALWHLWYYNKNVLSIRGYGIIWNDNIDISCDELFNYHTLFSTNSCFHIQFVLKSIKIGGKNGKKSIYNSFV